MRVQMRLYMFVLPLLVAIAGAFLYDAIAPQMIDESGLGALAYLEPFSVERRRGEPWIFPGGRDLVDAILYTFEGNEPIANPNDRALVDVARAGRAASIDPLPQPAYIEAEAPKDIPLPTATPKPRAASGATSSGKYALGQAIDKVRVTHYCSCGECNGYDHVAITATGKRLTEGMCALNWLPFGSIVMVDNTYYLVEDRGVGAGKIDVYVDGGHGVALARGKHYSTLRIVRIGRNGPMWDGATITRHPLDGRSNAPVLPELPWRVAGGKALGTWAFER